MAKPRSGGPYIWVTLLSKLLAGDESCEYAGWFKAQHEPQSWQRGPPLSIPLSGRSTTPPWSMTSVRT